MGFALNLNFKINLAISLIIKFTNFIDFLNFSFFLLLEIVLHNQFNNTDLPYITFIIMIIIRETIENNNKFIN